VAAYLWRSVLALALLCAIAAATALAAIKALSPGAAAVGALAVLPLVPLGMVLLSALMARIAPESPAARPGIVQLLRAAPGESLDFSRAVLAMSFARRPPPPAASCGRPVLLIHGILCNRAVWGILPQRLRAAGFGPVLAVDLEPLLADIEQQARRAQAALTLLQRLSAGARVTVVGHSMGGLVARVLLRNLGADDVSRVITIATPHHGTRLAAGLPWPATRQLSWTSPWLRALNASQEGQFSVPVVSLYSLEDCLVVPATSARLAGAKLHEFRGLGHFGMVRSPLALEGIMAALCEGHDP
jgi:pimeloyl-ACP methyl ester carboxylesterase